ncbi:guanylate kinase [Elioraea sp.]|uniref:guanylate kinase n=1 Tax=Elioraea sp. TaxID=2185103 RepID=UPI0025C3FF6D|nr:guanylate kinase [Elioraea sp.]
MSEAATETIARRGLLLVLSSPSGGGKTSVGRALREADTNLHLSVSLTTRAARPGEADGVDYHFVDEPTFLRAIEANAMVEHAQVYAHRYGTPRAPVAQALDRGHDMLFDIDWQGTQQLRAALPGDVVSIYLLPPGMDELARRLAARAQDDAAVVARRMAQAASEITHWNEYDYVLVNSDFDATVAAARAILAAERLRRSRRTGLAPFVAALLGG